MGDKPNHRTSRCTLTFWLINCSLVRPSGVSLSYNILPQNQATQRVCQHGKWPLPSQAIVGLHQQTT